MAFLMDEIRDCFHFTVKSCGEVLQPSPVLCLNPLAFSFAAAMSAGSPDVSSPYLDWSPAGRVTDETGYFWFADYPPGAGK
jgi:hypothetical protein